MEQLLLWLYLADAVLLITHEIDSAYWKEWNLFYGLLPGRSGSVPDRGGLSFFLLIHLPAVAAVMWGLIEVWQQSTAGSVFAIVLGAVGVFAFCIHMFFLRRGHPEFHHPVSLGILVSTLLVSLALLAVAIMGIAQPRADRFPPMEDGEAAILFAGDVFLGHKAQAIMDREGVDYPLSGLAPIIRSADAMAVFGNHEGPLTLRLDKHKPNGKWNYTARPETAGALSRAGFTHMSLANNHTLDRGMPGALDSAQHLQEAGIEVLGLGETRDAAAAPAVVLAGDTRVAVVALIHPWEKYRKAGWYATGTEGGLAELAKPALPAILARARDEADVVVVYPHWGGTYSPISDSQRRLAGRLIEHGPDVIVGHHSHNAQAVGLVDSVPVVWGLGNACFGSAGGFGRQPGYGLLARLVVAGGQARRIELLPIRINNRLVHYRPAPCTVAESRRVLADLAAPENAALRFERGVGILQLDE